MERHDSNLLEIEVYLSLFWNELICNFLCFVQLSDPQSRPTFQELVEKLKDLQRQFVIQAQAARSTAGDSSQKEQ